MHFIWINDQELTFIYLCITYILFYSLFLIIFLCPTVSLWFSFSDFLFLFVLIFFFLKGFVYLESRKKHRERSSLYWFPLQMAAVVGAGLVWSQKFLLGLPCGWQGPRHLSYFPVLSQVAYQRAWWEMEQLCRHCREEGVCGSCIYRAPVLAPSFSDFWNCGL